MRRRAILWMIGAATLAAFMAAPVNQAAALEVKRITLANGTIVLVSPQHNLPMVTAAIAFDAGARRDPKGKEGLAHLTADCLMEGTRKITADEFNQQGRFSGQRDRYRSRQRLQHRRLYVAEALLARHAQVDGRRADRSGAA